MRITLTHRTLLLTAIVGLAVQTIARCADLLDLVGNDVAACVRMQRAKEHSKQLEASELAARLASSSFFSAWRSGQDFQKLVEAEAAIRSLSGKPVRATLEELLGQDVVVAMFLRPDGQQSVIALLNAESPEALQAALKLWNQLDPFEHSKRTHRDREYVQLKKPSNGQSLFYTVLDATLALSEDEALIRRTLDLKVDGKSMALSDKPEIQAALKRESEQDLVSVHLNPRAWDEMLASMRQNWPPFSRAIWTRTQWLSLRLIAGDGLKLTAALDYDNSDTPSWWQQLVSNDPAGDAAIGTVLPSASLLAASGRLRTASLREVVKVANGGKPLPTDAERARRIARGMLLGLDPFDEVLPQLGPNWSGAIVPRTAKDSAFPVDGVFVLELRPAAKSGKQPVDTALDNALNATLNMIAALQNSKDPRDIAIVSQKSIDGTTIRSVGPLGVFQPSIAVTNRFVVFSSSTELCERTLSDLKAPTNASSTNNANPTIIGQKCIANVQAARALLVDRREWFLKQAARDKVPEDEAARRLKDADELLGLLDGAAVALNGDSSLLELTFEVTAQKR